MASNPTQPPGNLSEAIEQLEKSNEEKSQQAKDLLGHDLEELKRAIEEIRPRLQELTDTVGDQARYAKSSLEEQIQKNPWATVGLVGAAAFVIGWLVSGEKKVDMKWFSDTALYLVKMWLGRLALAQAKQKGLLIYLKTLQAVRRSLIATVAALCVLQMMVISLLGMIVTLVFLSDWTQETKLWTLFGVFAVLGLIPLLGLAYFLSSKFWFKMSGVQKQMASLTPEQVFNTGVGTAGPEKPYTTSNGFDHYPPTQEPPATNRYAP